MEEELEQHLQRAVQLLHIGNARSAIEAVKQVLAINPNSGDAHAILSLCLLSDRRIHAAEHEARLALGIDPESLNSHQAAAMINLQKRDVKKAELHAEFLMSKAPENPSYHRIKADVYNMSGHADKANKILAKALALDPNDVETLVSLARHRIASRKITEAEAILIDALYIEPGQKDAVLLMGYVHLHKNELDEAHSNAVFVLSIDPSDVEAIRLLSEIKARKNLLLGSWWRLNAWLTKGGTARVVVTLVSLYMAYRIGFQVLLDLDYTIAGQALTWAWYALILFSWIGYGLFQKQLRKELMPVELDEKF